MRLSEDEKQRIREEELVRLQAREEFQRSQPTLQRPQRRQQTFVYSAVVLGVLMLLWTLARSSS